MEINPMKLGLAAAITFIVLWIVCSALVFILPNEMLLMSGHMVHAKLDHLAWTLTLTGFFVGLIAWATVAFISGWMIARIYNYTL